MQMPETGDLGERTETGTASEKEVHKLKRGRSKKIRQ